MARGAGLLAMACGTFALGMAEFSMMAVLTPVARSLGVSIPAAGDFISAYALGVTLGSPLPLLLRSRPYKHILLILCAVICAGNALTACAQGYFSLLACRFLAGLPHGAYFGVAAIFATTLVERGRRASAVAIMVSGMTVANLAGVPFATWLANSLSWRWAFLIAAFFGCAAFLGILFLTPARHHGEAGSLKAAVSFLRGAAPWLIFLATFLGQASVYCWYSYMEPIMLQVAHFAPDNMKWVMVAAGLGMFGGNLVAGKLADHYHPAIVSGVTALMIIPALAAIYYFSANQILATVMVFAGAALLFALGGPMQYLIVRFSRGGEILGGAGIQIAFNSSNALAAWLGGLCIHAHYGLTSPALLGIPFAAIAACIIFWFYRRYGRVPL